MSPPSWLARTSWAALALLLAFGVLTVSAGDWAVHAFRLGIFALGLLWAVVLFFRRFAVRWSLPLAVPAAAGIWGLVQIQAGWTVYRHETWNATLGWCSLATLGWVARQIFTDQPARIRFLEMLAWFAAAISILGTVQANACPGRIFCIFNTPYDNDVLGPFVNRDHFCAFVELALPVMLWLPVHNRRRWLWYSVIAGASFSAVIGSASRAGALLVTIELIVVTTLMLTRARLHYPQRTVAGVVVITAVFSAIVGWNTLVGRFDGSDPFAYRRETTESSLRMIRDRPLTGFGLGTWATVYPQYVTVDPGLYFAHAHNDWVEWTAEGGLPFAAGIVGLFLWTALGLQRSPWAAGAVVILLHGAVDFPMQKPVLAAITIVLMAAMSAERAQPDGADSPRRLFGRLRRLHNRDAGQPHAELRLNAGG